MRHVVSALLLAALGVRPVSVTPAAPVPPARRPAVEPVRRVGDTEAEPKSEMKVTFVVGEATELPGLRSKVRKKGT